MRVLTHRLVWLAVLVAWGAGIGHAQTQKPAQTPAQPVTSKPKPKPVPTKPVGTMTAVELEAAKYVSDSTRLRLPYRLNLGDERQYTYVLAMLRLAGDSPQRSPQLYKNLAAARANGKAGPPELAMGEKLGVGQNTTLVTPINLIEYIFDDDVNATGSLLSSVPGGTDNTTMMVNYRIQNQATPFAFSPLFKQSGGGKQFLQRYVAAMPSGQTQANVVASSLILASKGGNTTPYTMQLDDGNPNATSICATAPNYVKQQAPPIQCPAVGATCINNGPITTPILSCYGRNQADCSYVWGGGGYPPSMTLAIAGSMTFPYPVDPALQGTFLLNLQRSDGGCYLPPGGGEPMALNATNFSISKTDPNTLNFCFPGAQFPNSGCLVGVTGNVFVDLSVYVTLDVQSGPNIGMGKISSNGADNPHQPYWAQIPIITAMQGCFAPGTEITLADGTTRKVEQFKGDGSETVMLDAKGTIGKVAGTGEGVEMKPMLRITDSGGNAVTVTETHPIITGRGAKMAWQVRVGDTLRVRKGTTRIAKIDALPVTANQKVHNLYIGDMKQAAAGKTTVFANGILVGDMFMQNELFQQGQKQGFTQAEILSRLPKEWHQDYLNSIKYRTDRK